MYDENVALFKSSRTGRFKLVIKKERQELVAERLIVASWKLCKDIIVLTPGKPPELLFLKHGVLLSQVGKRICHRRRKLTHLIHNINKG